MKTVVLIATILPRKRSCERLLEELTQQTKQPDGVLLVLDGYGANESAPSSPLPILHTFISTQCLGAGARWRAVSYLHPEDIVICLDDDITLAQAPCCINALVCSVVVGKGAAAAMGRQEDGKPAPPLNYSRGTLSYAAGCGFAVRAGALATLPEFAARILEATGTDMLGLHGDDDALVSAYLWHNKVRVLHAGTGNIYPAPGTQASSQTAANRKAKRDPDAQKVILSKLTGWPWKERKIQYG